MISNIYSTVQYVRDIKLQDLIIVENVIILSKKNTCILLWFDYAKNICIFPHRQ